MCSNRLNKTVNLNALDGHTVSTDHGLQYLTANTDGFNFLAGLSMLRYNVFKIIKIKYCCMIKSHGPLEFHSEFIKIAVTHYISQINSQEPAQRHLGRISYLPLAPEHV